MDYARPKDFSEDRRSGGIGCRVAASPAGRLPPGLNLSTWAVEVWCRAWHCASSPTNLSLRHTFTVASYSRTTTPGVQVEVEYDGLVGYGEASMPPYLGETTDSVTAFLRRVDLGRFSSPFLLEDILAYVDGLSPRDTAAKAAVDIALHDLVGKLLGAPWHRIWGLDPAKAPSTTFTIGIDTPQVVKEKSARVCRAFQYTESEAGRRQRPRDDTCRAFGHLAAHSRGRQSGLDRPAEGS